MTGSRTLRTRALVALVALTAVGCSTGEEVRSGSGPGVRDTTTAEPGRPDDGDSGDEERETSTTAAPATPATSPLLTVVGTATIPDGDPGQLSVVIVGAPDGTGGSVPVAVRNRTGTTLYSVEATGTARGADGSLAGSGSSQGFHPNVVEPGEWAFGYLYFSGDLPDGATFDVTATASDDADFFSAVDLPIVESNRVAGTYGDSVVGIVRNDTSATVAGPVGVALACFDDTGTTLAAVTLGFADGDEIPPGGTVSFEVSVPGDGPCPNYVLAASGWDF